LWDGGDCEEIAVDWVLPGATCDCVGTCMTEEACAAYAPDCISIFTHFATAAEGCSQTDFQLDCTLWDFQLGFCDDGASALLHAEQGFPARTTALPLAYLGGRKLDDESEEGDGADDEDKEVDDDDDDDGDNGFNTEVKKGTMPSPPMPIGGWGRATTEVVQVGGWLGPHRTVGPGAYMAYVRERAGERSERATEASAEVG
jgi:hypothetical protein